MNHIYINGNIIGFPKPLYGFIFRQKPEKISSHE